MTRLTAYTRPPLRPPVGPLRPPTPPHPVLAAHGAGFVLFLLVNAVMFLRPADLLPSLQGVELYQYLILGCFAVSFPAVLERLSSQRLEEQPISLCLLLLLPVMALSSAAHDGVTGAAEHAFAYFKLLVYYLLFVSLVTTPARVRAFTGWFIVFAAGTTVVSILAFHGVIQLPRILTATGKLSTLDAERMYGPGIFQDPNDVCVLIVTALVLLVGRLLDKEGGTGRWLWLVVLPVFVYGFYRTQSRGGLLALLVGLGLLIRLQFGWRRAILLGVPGVVLLVALLGARQTDISANTNTGRERLWLWNDGVVMVRDNPFFGAGWGHYSDHAGQVAHNSYMDAFGETGLLGGTLFLGAAFLAVWGLYRLALPVTDPGRRPVPRRLVDPDLRRLHPALNAAVAAWAMGMVTLTLVAMVPTYTILGLACVVQTMAVTQPPRPPLRFDLSLAARLLGLGVLFLAAMFVFLRLFMQT